MPRTLDPVEAGPILTGPATRTKAGTATGMTGAATGAATASTAIDPAAGTARSVADALIAFMESGQPREGLFSVDSFCDLTLPTWRL